jgi:hypothetical protein
VGHSGGGIFISAIDQARFVFIILRKAKVKNEQLVSKIQCCLPPSQVPNESYGIWWMNKRKPGKASPDVYSYIGFEETIKIDNANDLVRSTRWMDDRNKTSEAIV